MERNIDPPGTPRVTTSADQALEHLEGVAISESQALKTPADEAINPEGQHLYPLPDSALDTLQKAENQLTPASRRIWQTISAYVRGHPKKTFGLGLGTVLLGMWWARGRAHR